MKDGDDMKELGQLIIQSRKKKGMTQDELAEKLKVTRQAVSKWEHNETKPDIDNICKLCEVLDLTIEDFSDSKVLRTKLQINPIWIYATICVVVGVIVGSMVTTNLFQEEIPRDFIINQEFDFRDNYFTIYRATARINMENYDVSCIYEENGSGDKTEVEAYIDGFKINCGYRTQINQRKHLYLRVRSKDDEQLVYWGWFQAEGESNYTTKVN